MIKEGTMETENPRRDIKRELADRIRQGEKVALYCYGILADYLLAYLNRFYSVHPTVIVDNDIRKKGVADFDVPVMPYAEAKERYGNLRYFICSDDFKYTIIGDLLEKGEKPENIINYVPVEKRRSCLYFYNRLLLVQGKKDKGDTHYISHCNADSFKSTGLTTAIAREKNGYRNVGQVLDGIFKDFEDGKIDVCKHCVMNQEQYIVKSDHPKHYKSLAFYQQTCEDCISHCVYCCVGGSEKGNGNASFNTLESFSDFAKMVLSLNRMDNDFTCAIDVSERNQGQKVENAVHCIEKAELMPLVYKINSCHLNYSDVLEDIMGRGLAYSVWSLDAGTAETYRKVKQVDAFERAVENVKRYIAADVFDGKFIVPKYLIVKGMNDNEDEFDAFLKLVKSLGLKTVSLSFDYRLKAEEEDMAFIRLFYEKIVRDGLRLTYVNDSEPVTRAINRNNIMRQ